MDTVYLSDSAYRDIVLETAEHPTIETGGILIGAAVEGAWYVVEVLDPGPRTVRSAAYFEYNHTYATHLANKVARRYQATLRLLGLWHRHPGSLDVFSSVDDDTHVEYLELLRGSFVSMLVNVDPDFRMTFYRVDAGGRRPRYSRLEFEVGDGRFPATLLQRKDAGEVARSLRRPSLRDRRPPETMPMPGSQAPAAAIEVMARDYREQPPVRNQPQGQPSAEPGRPGVFQRAIDAVSDLITPRTVNEAPHYPAFQGEQEREAPRRKASAEQRDMLDMMEAEFDFLDAHGSLFQYHVSPQEPGFRLEVSVVRGQVRLPYPDFVEFSFYYRGDVPVVAIDGQERPYKPGVVGLFYKQYDAPAEKQPAAQTSAPEPRHEGPPPSPDRARQ